MIDVKKGIKEYYVLNVTMITIIKIRFRIRDAKFVKIAHKLYR